jgi:hypothetical protein
VKKANTVLHAFNRQYGAEYEIHNLVGETVARIPARTGDFWKLTQMMAAGPDLLSASKSFMSYVDDGCLVHCDHLRLVEILAKISQAINKAEGRA